MGSTPTARTVAVAEMVMHRIVAPNYAGSNPVGHLSNTDKALAGETNWWDACGDC